MNSPVRAAADMKADPADAPILRLTHTDNALAEMRREVTVLGRRSSELAPIDIAASRMRALADRIADARRAPPQLAAGSDAARAAEIDSEIAPVSLAAITGLRALRAASPSDVDGTPKASLAPPQNERAALPETETVASGKAVTSVIAAGAEPSPVPLRLAPASLAAPQQQPTDVDFVASPPEHLLPALLDPAGPRQLLDHLGQLPPNDATAPSDDQLAADIRLVDLIRRQQTLLEQLNSYPGPSAPPAARSVVEQLAPTAAQITQAVEPQPSTEVEPAPEATADNAADAPPPTLSALAPPASAADPELPERSPMIIQRARAERSGRLSPGDAYKPPSPLPAFAAGLTVALAIAGTLFYLL